MATLFGYAGKILKVDLTTKSITEIPSEEYLPKYVGGRILAAKLYWDFVPPEDGPFDPSNALIFAQGLSTARGLSPPASSSMPRKPL
jgi:aldehyde:ferredoxin oxidoreductase